MIYGFKEKKDREKWLYGEDKGQTKSIQARTTYTRASNEDIIRVLQEILNRRKDAREFICGSLV